MTFCSCWGHFICLLFQTFLSNWKHRYEITEWIIKYKQLHKIWKWFCLMLYFFLSKCIDILILIYSSVLKLTCYSLKFFDQIQVVFIEKPSYSCILLVATDDEEEPPAHFIHIGYVLLSSSNWTLNLIYSGNIIFN